jgi:cytochrome oxidase assembly protein ShyY1
MRRMSHLEFQEKGNSTSDLTYITMASTVGLSTGGKAFFGSLCASTFGLGCWQLQRLYEKLGKIEDRQQQLQMSPTKDWQSQEHPYRCRLVNGCFLHDKEVLIGPRGAPNGVTLPRKGLSAKRGGGGQSSGSAPGPQGYFVLTPMELQDKSTVWINRGWVPKTMVPDGRRGPPVSSWSRPKEATSLTAIRSSPESE